MWHGNIKINSYNNKWFIAQLNEDMSAGSGNTKEKAIADLKSNAKKKLERYYRELEHIKKTIKILQEFLHEELLGDNKY